MNKPDTSPLSECDVSQRRTLTVGHCDYYGVYTSHVFELNIWPVAGAGSFQTSQKLFCNSDLTEVEWS